MSRKRKLEELIEINTAISSRLDSRDLLKSITLSALALLDADSAEVWLLENPSRGGRPADTADPEARSAGGLAGAARSRGPEAASESVNTGDSPPTLDSSLKASAAGERLPAQKQYRFRLLASAGTSDPLTADTESRTEPAPVLVLFTGQIEHDYDRSFIVSGLDAALGKALGGAETGGYRATRAESAFFAIDEHSHGLFTVSREEPRPFQGEDYYFLEKLAIQAGISLSTSQRFEEIAGERDRALAGLEKLKRRTLIGGSAALKEVQRLIDLAAPSSASILILGERGVGKELVADALHRESERAAAPFIKLNCAGLVESLLESELFGYEKGAFTGADKTRSGLLEAADGGTLFLDEVGEMSPAMQAKLLRFLQEGSFRRVGGNKQEIEVDVRIVAATNRDIAGDGDVTATPGAVNAGPALAEAAAARISAEDASNPGPGLMRRDLFDRLATIVLRIPALRERREDIAPLMQHFLERYTVLENKTEIKGFAPAIFALMEAAEWPGNVRELENAVHRLVILHPGGPLIQNTDQVFVARRQGTIDGGAKIEQGAPPAGDGQGATDLAGASDSEYRPGPEGPDAPPERIYFDARDAFEADYIRRALAAARGNISKAAQQSGLDRGNFRLKMNKHEIDAADFKTKKK
jgi:DNA-binding NtrC family response regulator